MKKFIFILIALYSLTSLGQTKRIKILKADNTYVTPEYPGATISLGNVFIEHDGATLRCDKAYIYKDQKLIKALGNVIINQGDTIIQYSNYSDYDGNTKLATSWGKVILKDDFMTLTTDTLYFDRTNQKLYYITGGKIKDTTNVLTSKIGNYYLRTKKFEAFSNVNVTNKDSKLTSSHLDYYTNTGIAKIFGPSTIKSENNVIKTTRGYHNSRTNTSYFLDNSKLFFDEKIVEADSIFYNKNIEFASATGNIKISDSINDVVAKGNYAELFKLKDSMFITDEAIAISAVDKDSLYIHGDTIFITGKQNERLIKTYHGVKFFKSDLQGKCDSLISDEKSGITKLFKNPVLWAQNNQITGDSIVLISNQKTQKLDTLKIFNNAFVIQQDPKGYSQLKGKNMIGKFENNQLKSLNAIGNSESIIFIRNEFDILVGIDKKKCSQNIYIELEDNEFSFIDYNEMIEAKTYPPSEFKKLKENEQKFKGFIWREEERPISKEAIFIED